MSAALIDGQRHGLLPSEHPRPPWAPNSLEEL